MPRPPSLIIRPLRQHRRTRCTCPSRWQTPFPANREALRSGCSGRRGDRRRRAVVRSSSTADRGTPRRLCLAATRRPRLHRPSSRFTVRPPRITRTKPSSRKAASSAGKSVVAERAASKASRYRVPAGNSASAAAVLSASRGAPAARTSGRSPGRSWPSAGADSRWPRWPCRRSSGWSGWCSCG